MFQDLVFVFGRIKIIDQEKSHRFTDLYETLVNLW